MENVRIVQLGPNTKVQSVSFEDAFGEYSSAEGRRRKKHAERKEDRKETRQGNRIGRRAKRKAKRQESRTAQMEARQGRKLARKGHRIERRELGHPDEQEVDNTAVENGTPSKDQYEEQGGYDTNQNQGGGGDTGGAQDASAGYGDSSSDSSNNGYAGESQTTENSNVETGEEELSEEEGSEEGDGGEDSGFDGIMGAEDRYSEFAKTVSPQVRDITKKIEWNKEVIARLTKARGVAESEGRDETPFNKNIANRRARIAELENMLQGYSSANGGSQKQSRKNEIARGRKLATWERKQIGKNKISGGSETPVNAELNPQFGEQTIVVPSESNATGPTGLNGIDLVNDFDAPPIRTVELVSNASGPSASGSKIDWKLVAIGAAVAVAGIWAYNKYVKKK